MSELGRPLEAALRAGMFFSDDEGRLKDSQHALLVGIVCSFAGKI